MSFLDKLKKNVASAVTSAASALGATEKSYTFEEIPATLEELKARPEANLKDGAGVAALAIIALNVYAVDSGTGIEMLNFLRGPAGPLSPMDLSFLKDRFSDKDYVPRSYFNGAAPTNNYEPSEPYTIVVGNPARVLRKRFDDELIELLLRFKWWDKTVEEIDALIPILTCSDLQRVKLEIKARLLLA